eukprot:TRINITY_DN4013_c0_g1::TRINITY_DN4013_c0_g1_i1::g.11873::m.11873 TRINITY_DN4013_c0_g1::TRINITY_DN4013_c0_g1_i1::g.11873  ORF type:complete len:602 (+),score=102.88,sp/Q8SRP3/TF2B_ENCCU/27.22/1e-12,TFIIB/PF00382.14/3.6e-06,TFIIB/PF00382.14/1.4e+02,TFIIB/PF00382.14/1e+04,TipAS/PF07739.8/2,TipAS/PF07739.8/2.8e+02 TRINITY_DN4013_c0_g1_i1:489-2294(+)
MKRRLVEYFFSDSTICTLTYFFHFKLWKGRSTDATIAACIYLGCKYTDCRRPPTDIYVPLNVSRKDFNKCMKAIDSDTDIKGRFGSSTSNVSTAEDYTNRFCNNLKNDPKFQVAAGPKFQGAVAAVCRASRELGLVDSKAQKTVAAAAILHLALLVDEKIATSAGSLRMQRLAELKKSITYVCDVADGTVKNAYKDIFHYEVSLERVRVHVQQVIMRLRQLFQHKQCGPDSPEVRDMMREVASLIADASKPSNAANELEMLKKRWTMGSRFCALYERELRVEGFGDYVRVLYREADETLAIRDIIDDVQRAEFPGTFTYLKTTGISSPGFMITPDRPLLLTEGMSIDAELVEDYTSAARNYTGEAPKREKSLNEEQFLEAHKRYSEAIMKLQKRKTFIFTTGWEVFVKHGEMLSLRQLIAKKKYVPDVVRRVMKTQTPEELEAFGKHIASRIISKSQQNEFVQLRIVDELIAAVNRPDWEKIMITSLDKARVADHAPGVASRMLNESPESVLPQIMSFIKKLPTYVHFRDVIPSILEVYRKYLLENVSTAAYADKLNSMLENAPDELIMFGQAEPLESMVPADFPTRTNLNALQDLLSDRR